MRHLIPLSTTLLLLCACTNLLDYNSGEPAEVIIMNAMLMTDETEHTVNLNRGLIDRCEALDDADVTCYINGRLAAHAVPAKKQGAYYGNSSPYSFTAEIRPGDEIRLEAASGTMRASATVMVPQPATLVAVDTATVTDSPYSHAFAGYGYGNYGMNSMGFRKGRILSCKMTLKDRPGETNWYRIRNTVEIEQQDHYPDHPDYDQTRALRRDWSFGFDLDPILSDGYQTKEQDLDVFIDPVYNNYCSFRDIRFADGEATVEIHLASPAWESWIPYASGQGSEEENAIHTFQPKVILRFLTLSGEEFNYLSAINHAQSYGFDWNTLIEPVPFPSNVEGGLGLVTAASASDFTLEFPSYTEEGVLVQSPIYFYN